MAKVDVLDILRTKKLDPLEFHFENLWIPPMNCYLSPSDIDALHKIATSVRLSSKIQQKYKMIDDIMVARGFKRFSAGTNRVVYRFLEDTRFLVKIAVDKVGMQDNPLEYENQFLLQPFVTKMFYVSPCGTVGFSERVLPIKNKEEFRQIASDVFDILVNKILGLYVVEDVGTKYFMNWGIRPGFGPVLLDYPYVYKLDGDKLFCNWTNPMTGECCNGEIDYDAGFNHLVCTRCNKTYMATDLRDNSIDNKIVIKRGGFQMRIQILQGDQIVSEPIPTDDVMVKPTNKPKKNTGLVVAIDRPDSDLEVIRDEDNNEPENKVVKTVGIVIETPSTDNQDGEDISHIIKENNMWSPDADSEGEDTPETVPEEETHEKEDTHDVANEEDVPSDHFDNNDVESTPDSETHDDDDEPEMVFASDINLQKPKPLRNAKGQFIASEDGPKKGKKKKTGRDGTKSTFIPRSN